MMPLYRTLIHGSGFELPGDGDPVIGFVTSRVLFAENPSSAADRARHLVLEEWQNEQDIAAPDLDLISCDRLTPWRHPRLALRALRHKGRGGVWFCHPDQLDEAIDIEREASS